MINATVFSTSATVFNASRKNKNAGAGADQDAVEQCAAQGAGNGQGQNAGQGQNPGNGNAGNNGRAGLQRLGRVG